MKPKYAAFSALDPFFEVVRRGLSGLVDGEHYFDTIAKNAIFEFRYDIAGWPKRVEGRDALMALYRGYGVAMAGLALASRRQRNATSGRILCSTSSSGAPPSATKA
jgi:hypothetical protein